MRLVPADTYSFEQLADIFNEGYEGYVVPMRVDPPTLESMVNAWDVDLSRSRIALRDGDDPVGIALLAVRGDRGWVGGLGVAPGARREGIGRALMEAVLAEAPDVVRLEVIEQNETARKLYDELGFRELRLLEVWTLKADVDPVAARSVEPSPPGEQDPPWQRADASLPAGYERIEVDGGAAAILVRGDRVSVFQIAADHEHAARALLQAARGRGSSVHVVNIPVGSVASAALAELGGCLDLRQHELQRP
jgi:ribosomal protein S18 acetylase RimI-like enzyme